MPAERPTHPIRSLLKQSSLYASFKQLGHYPDYWYWKLRGQPRRIPHVVKQRTVLQYAQAYALDTLIETGTYYGEMIAAVVHRFRRIYSIELDSDLAEQARKRFQNYSHVEIIQGDSQIIVPDLLRRLSGRSLFWLDAGYCGWSGGVGNPNRLGAEFSAILSDRIPDHVILMDDADGIVAEDGSPALADVIAFVESGYPNRRLEVAQNIIRVTPR